MLERKLGTEERLVGALALGAMVAGGASPVWALATPALAAIAWRASPDSLTPKPLDALVLAGLAITALAVGLPIALGAALAWRVCVEVRAGAVRRIAGGVSTTVLQEWAAPLAALLYCLDAPVWAQLAGFAATIVIVADWAIRRLAEWRLGELRPHAVLPFVARQSIVVLPLLLLPSTLSALTALLAATLLRKARLPAPRPA